MPRVPRLQCACAVLLDRFLNAKICDVGMSKLLQGDQTTPAFANPGTLAWSVRTLCHACCLIGHRAVDVRSVCRYASVLYKTDMFTLCLCNAGTPLSRNARLRPWCRLATSG